MACRLLPLQPLGLCQLSPPGFPLGLYEWGAEGSSSGLHCIGKFSPPRSDHPASTSHGTPMGIGMARLQEYLSSLVIVIYFAVPSISRASFLETAIVSGSCMLAGCCPGLVAAPFKC